MAGETAADTAVHVYRLGPWRRLAGPLTVAIGAPVVFIFGVAGTQNSAFIYGFVYFLALILFALGVFWLWGRHTTRLELSVEGIDYRSLGIRVRTPWSNVEAIGEEGTDERLLAGLVLRKAMVELSPWVVTGMRLVQPLYMLEPLRGGMSIGEHSYQGYGRVVPLADFDSHWQRGPIGDDIRTHAPWVFTDKPAAKPKRGRPRRK